MIFLAWFLKSETSKSVWLVLRIKYGASFEFPPQGCACPIFPHPSLGRYLRASGRRRHAAGSFIWFHPWLYWRMLPNAGDEDHHLHVSPASNLVQKCAFVPSHLTGRPRQSNFSRNIVNSALGWQRLNFRSCLELSWWGRAKWKRSSFGYMISAASLESGRQVRKAPWRLPRHVWQSAAPPMPPPRRRPPPSVLGYRLGDGWRASSWFCR